MTTRIDAGIPGLSEAAAWQSKAESTRTITVRDLKRRAINGTDILEFIPFPDQEGSEHGSQGLSP